MAKTLVFRNIGQLMTMAGAVKRMGRVPSRADLGVISKAAMAIQGHQVLWVGRERHLPKMLTRARSIDVRGQNVFPGFIDCHTHLVFAGERHNEFELRNQGVSYQEIAARGGGIHSTVVATRKATEGELVRLAQQRINNFLRQGVTTVEVKSGYGLDEKTELKILRVANQLAGARILPTFLGAHGIPKSATSEQAYLADLKRMLPKVLPLTDRIDIFVEKGYFTQGPSRDYLKFAQHLGFKIAIHADQLHRTGGAELAVELGALSADHVIEISQRDVEKLARSETTAVLLPTADLYLHTHYPPARKLIDAGARCALASDFNPGSSPTQNLGLVGLLARLKMKMTLPEVFVGFTVAAAHALAAQHHLGALLPQYNADFFISPQPWDEFFYDSLPAAVSAVWRDGRKIRSL